MYKLVSNGLIVDVVKKLRYVKYIPELKKITLTSYSSAHGVCGSDNKTFYALSHNNVPKEKSYWKRVECVEIDYEEYKSLKESLKVGSPIHENHFIVESKNNKILEMSSKCNESIVNGFVCKLSDGKECHFRLTIEDQMNLLDIQKEIEMGHQTILFHSTKEMCKLFSIEDATLICEEASKHRRYHTTYFNLLKFIINNISDKEFIDNIKYGDDIKSMSIKYGLYDCVKNIISCI